jgi:hypothetical protein
MIRKVINCIQHLVFNAQCHEAETLYDVIVTYYGTTGRKQSHGIVWAMCFQVGRCPMCSTVGLTYHKNNMWAELIVECMYCESKWSIWTPLGLIVKVY